MRIFYKKLNWYELILSYFNLFLSNKKMQVSEINTGVYDYGSNNKYKV